MTEEKEGLLEVKWEPCGITFRDDGAVVIGPILELSKSKEEREKAQKEWEERVDSYTKERIEKYKDIMQSIGQGGLKPNEKRADRILTIITQLNDMDSDHFKMVDDLMELIDYKETDMYGR